MGNHFCDFSLSDAVIQRAPYVMTDPLDAYSAVPTATVIMLRSRGESSSRCVGINNLIQQISQVGGLRESPEIRGQDFPVAPVGSAGR